MAVKTKSLLSKTSKPKKPKTQSKKATKSTEYQFEVGDVLVYLGGVIESQNKQECKVISRSRNHIQCSYKVEFSDGRTLECIPDVLIFVSDFEDQLAKAEEYKDDVDEMSEEEIRILSLGLEPYRNKHACLSPLDYYRKSCPECTHNNRCIYVKKCNYIKLD